MKNLKLHAVFLYLQGAVKNTLLFANIHEFCQNIFDDIFMYFYRYIFHFCIEKLIFM